MNAPDLTESISVDDDAAMIAVARRRGIVRLRTGMLATLVSWGKPRRNGVNGGGARRVRLEAPDGETQWTALKSDIIEVVQ